MSEFMFCKILTLFYMYEPLPERFHDFVVKRLRSNIVNCYDLIFYLSCCKENVAFLFKNYIMAHVVHLTKKKDVMLFWYTFTRYVSDEFLLEVIRSHLCRLLMLEGRQYGYTDNGEAIFENLFVNGCFSNRWLELLMSCDGFLYALGCCIFSKNVSVTLCACGVALLLCELDSERVLNALAMRKSVVNRAFIFCM
jgi:hypothetical protein